nr:MAG TPA: hypothetical protein [Caudoviricetes sp.]
MYPYRDRSIMNMFDKIWLSFTRISIDILPQEGDMNECDR